MNDEDFKDEVFVTTIDNPYDYFKDFDRWYAYDTQMGYNTCGLVARISRTSLEESSYNYNKEVERAVDQICKWNLLGLYKKIHSRFPNPVVATPTY